MLTAGEQRFIYQVDLYKGEIAQLESINDKDHPLQIHIAAYVMRHAMGVNLLAHLGIGKRVTYRVTRKEKTYTVRFFLSTKKYLRRDSERVIRDRGMT